MASPENSPTAPGSTSTGLRETEDFDLLGYARPADASSAVLRAVRQARQARRKATADGTRPAPATQAAQPSQEPRRIGVIPEHEENAECACWPFEVLEPDEEPGKWSVAVVGGTEHVVGGWSGYEAARRRYHAGGCGCYQGRSYVTSEEAVASLLRASDRREASGGAPPLEQAAKHLASSLTALEQLLREDADPFARLGVAGLTLTPLTPGDVTRNIEAAGHDPATLLALAESAELAAAGLAVPSATGGGGGGRPESARSLLAAIEVPPAPSQTAKADDAGALRRLEAEVVPRASAIERYQGAVAELLEKAALQIDRALGASGRKQAQAGARAQPGEIPKDQLDTRGGGYTPRAF